MQLEEDDEMKVFIKNPVDTNCQVTLTQIKAGMKFLLPSKPRVSLVTIMKVLDGMLYTVSG